MWPKACRPSHDWTVVSSVQFCSFLFCPVQFSSVWPVSRSVSLVAAPLIRSLMKYCLYLLASLARPNLGRGLEATSQTDAAADQNRAENKHGLHKHSHSILSVSVWKIRPFVEGKRK